MKPRYVRHCATCRCASTITGQIAILLDGQGTPQLTCEEIAEAIGYAGESIYLRTTLDRMAREEKILRTGKRYGAMPENVADLRVWAKRKESRSSRSDQ